MSCSRYEHTKASSRLLRVGLCGLLDLDGIVDDQVHELVKSLEIESVCAQVNQGDSITHSDGSLDADAQLFKQQYRDLCAGLKELENLVDWRQQHLSTTSASASFHSV